MLDLDALYVVQIVNIDSILFNDVIVKWDLYKI
jgi:hypothetical protein